MNMDMQEMQKMTALSQIIDPITRQHTATRGLKTFDEFCASAMMFANTNSLGWAGGAEAVKTIDAKKQEDGGEKEAEADYDYEQLNAFGKGGKGGKKGGKGWYGKGQKKGAGGYKGNGKGKWGKRKRRAKGRGKRVWKEDS